ncbi:hypothetical protein [Herbiconiux daphne]|uniref:Uncharacterized protein n=1 Tax=Herbiconiux daphne TaxID=2970914 RepID=A0ABT2HB99_9MICO|nr:hypothetical protein [Herbiconiux daphne]MCS5737225.1 hypothetical protein [Herbiconiux daphne]
MVVGQTIKVRRKGMGWSRERDFKISAIGDKGMLGYFDGMNDFEQHIHQSTHEWRENGKN